MEASPPAQRNDAIMRTPPGRPTPELDSLLRDGVASGLTDHELLERFRTRRQPAGELAFVALVARHGPMVLSVCRRILRDAADADDAFQATFLVLVKRAGAIRFEASLGPWLYGVSVRVARRVREVRSRARGVPLDDAAAQLASERSARVDRDLRFVIDEALARLPANYRAAIVLCYLEGMTHEQAAVHLRCPVGTVRSRLARGRDMLRHRLGSSGLGSVALLPEQTIQWGVPPARSVIESQLVTSTARTATRLAAGQPLAEIVPARLAELVTGATTTMTSTKLMMVASIALLGSVAAWGALGLAAKTGDDRGTNRADRAAVVEPPKLALALASMPESQAPAQTDIDPMTSYPFTLNPDKVREYTQLTVKFHYFVLTSGPVAVVPIDCERGTTGVMIIGSGKFQFKPEANKGIEGQFRAVMLRFNPADQPAIISFEKGEKGRDVGAVELSRQLLQTAIRHCYHSSNNVLIPSKGSLAAVIYSKEHGDLLISDAGKEVVAFNFTTRKKLYERK
jgi:RNA polymerase sigma factor (sigma-70 family)